MQMLTKEEIKVIDLFRTNLFKIYSIRQIMKKISKTSYGWAFRTIEKLKRGGIVNMKGEGHSNLCSLNLDNNLSLFYLSLLELQDAYSRKLPKSNITQLINAVPLSYFTFIISGSYASGKATKKSDIDVVVLVEDGAETKKILTILKNKGELMVPAAHPYVFTKTEFLQMLLSKEENYGKLIFKSKVILFGAENYYLIIREAIKNGFKG